MSDLNSLVLPDGLVHITPFSLCSCGNVTGGSATYPALYSSALGANRARFVPFRLSSNFVVANAFMFNGSAVAGNIDIGVYDAAGTKLGSTGSTAQSGTDQIQTIALSLVLSPGLFYLAMMNDNATCTCHISNWAVAAYVKMYGTAIQDVAFPLPATATFATNPGSSLLLFGITGRSVV